MCGTEMWQVVAQGQTVSGDARILQKVEERWEGPPCMASPPCTASTRP